MTVWKVIITLPSRCQKFFSDLVQKRVSRYPEKANPNNHFRRQADKSPSSFGHAATVAGGVGHPRAIPCLGNDGLFTRN